MTSKPTPSGVPLTALTTLAALAAGVLLLLAGCASPGATAPTRTLADPATLGAAAAADAVPWPADRWWQAYGDPQLDALVDRALAGQPSIAIAEARLRQAQAAAAAADADRTPRVVGGVDATYQRYTQNGLIPPPLAGRTEWNVGANLNGSYEIDLFGRKRDALAAAVGNRRAAEADAQAARVLLAANVASGWFSLGRLVDARAVATASLEQRQQVLALVRQRIGAGLDTTVELRQAEGLIAQSRVDIEALDEGIVRARHALAELSGQGPEALADAAPRLAPLRAVPLPAGLPADLLGRRADLAAQRWRVEAATREVDVARKQFYPNLNLVAFAGLASLGLGNVVDFGARQYGAGPALTLPIFEGGRLRANLQGRAAEVDAAVETWNQTLLRALREVADEVTSLQSIERQDAAQADATAAADAAFDLATQRYQAGIGNFLTVLTAQTNVLVQQRIAVDLKARHLTSEVALARALGGGFRAVELPARGGGLRAAEPAALGGDFRAVELPAPGGSFRAAEQSALASSSRAADLPVAGSGGSSAPVLPAVASTR